MEQASDRDRGRALRLASACPGFGRSRGRPHSARLGLAPCRPGGRSRRPGTRAAKRRGPGNGHRFSRPLRDRPQSDHKKCWNSSIESNSPGGSAMRARSCARRMKRSLTCNTRPRNRPDVDNARDSHPGGAPGLQIRRDASDVSGGFDFHSFPPLGKAGAMRDRAVPMSCHSKKFPFICLACSARTAPGVARAVFCGPRPVRHVVPGVHTIAGQARCGRSVRSAYSRPPEKAAGTPRGGCRR